MNKVILRVEEKAKRLLGDSAILSLSKLISGGAMQVTVQQLPPIGIECVSACPSIFTAAEELAFT